MSHNSVDRISKIRFLHHIKSQCWSASTVAQWAKLLPAILGVVQGPAAPHLTHLHNAPGKAADDGIRAWSSVPQRNEAPGFWLQPALLWLLQPSGSEPEHSRPLSLYCFIPLLLYHYLSPPLLHLLSSSAFPRNINKYFYKLQFSN